MRRRQIGLFIRLLFLLWHCDSNAFRFDRVHDSTTDISEAVDFTEAGVEELCVLEKSSVQLAFRSSLGGGSIVVLT